MILQKKLNFFVDDTNVNDINNRYTFESKSITGEVESGSTPAKEYKWTGNALTEAFDKNGNVLKDKGTSLLKKKKIKLRKKGITVQICRLIRLFKIRLSPYL